MKVLVACEESQRVCTAFRERGHEAYSCDIIECSGGHPEWHIIQDVLPLLNGFCGFDTMDGVHHYIGRRWDLIIAHPPCTYLSNAGAARLFPRKGELNRERYEKGLLAKEFFLRFLNADCEKLQLKIRFRREYMGYRHIHKRYNHTNTGSHTARKPVFG